MWSCDQSLVTVVFLWEKLSWPQLYKDFTRKTAFFDGWSWFKFNNSGLALGTNLKFFTSVATGLKLKVTKFWRLNPTFVEVTGEKLVGGTLFIPPILSTVFIPKYFYDKDTDDNNGNNKNDNNINNYNDNNNDDYNDNKEFITHFSRSTFFIFSNKRIKLAPSQL